jgi:hypothetical protein
MSKNEAMISEVCFRDRLEDEQLILIEEAIEGLYKEGKLVKALDLAGKPKMRKGHQVYKHIDHATAAERSYWFQENRPN